MIDYSALFTHLYYLTSMKNHSVVTVLSHSLTSHSPFWNFTVLCPVGKGWILWPSYTFNWGVLLCSKEKGCLYLESYPL